MTSGQDSDEAAVTDTITMKMAHSMARGKVTMRHPLTRALAGAGLTALDVATHLQVDPKTVDRWLGGRLPYPRHHARLSRLTGWTVIDLWPETVGRQPAPTADEIRSTYANRGLVPLDTWRSLFGRATSAIDIVAYSALFLLEDSAILRTLAKRAEAGVPVRIALGDVSSKQIARRGDEEQIGDLMAARIRNALVLVKPLRRLPKVTIRIHDRVLYSSIYRADNEALINTHVHGLPAAHAPVLHLRLQHSDGLTASYIDAIERVWAVAAIDPG
ncbi:XRE family transcriptional regulator [Dactylosporangium sp. AC04546]|uniref:XRE family transcriptional regulator n=1 Tax=Dactylosporangium sp. AC04546 TaxID=2862460 RepID=UPI001EDD0EBF|nr:XRE family transcriptional regulator [Dactylosporangium sp. AC04546]WVK82301.1 XRE family transcriptional regulator [Dactylosporangium sp. AC04546]